ncbi:Putative diguanylate cyclase YeaJ [Salmonella enterica subsp. enterica serovar Typhisuis]|uniref:diguanylate cyclase n=1 Tax=Salmonella enterica TaxID=28901 RepID=A0A749KVT8_SALER|nr:GGDEF domain-containing protein [Salmonella enterica subsp. enterica serovar Typhisuis]ECA7633358.1 GGDEF domain-containing protein [Salmonella enterica subsp. enterica serovar Infantis]HAF5734321.1 GGDEF domain-containing protein [Salmonella enterica]EAV9429481.1 GGDEF domain-containing protein [Salmonella enterica subsp. enterica serovar Typhisuis]EBY0744785.1 GGDEF domain-containing protein [Salmonella enterica subsp. enterica serovar Typhisuis]
MNLHHKALRHFISASVIVLTSSFLIYELIASDRAMNAYMRYIMERADSSFLYDKYQNQSIAAHLMRTFEAPGDPVTAEKRRAFCDAFEAINGTHGVNLTRHNYPALHGTLQTAATQCTDNLDDALLLPAFDQAVSINRSQDDHSHGLGTLELKFRYYVDLNKHYVYFYDLINSRRFAMHRWTFLQKGTMGINRKDIDKLFTGRTVISSIYMDDITQENVMSFLTPVYLAGTLKGIVMVDVNQDNLKNIFYTQDRPLVWRYLNVTLKDMDSGKEIIINQSKNNLFQYVNYCHDIPGGLRVSLSLDLTYFLVSSWKALAFYLLATALLLNMVRMHFRLYRNVTRENISDAMTGLYNRKILTPVLEQRLQRLVNTGTPVTFVAIDCDRLKLINDTQGHQEGDRIITLLAKAIKTSIRKSDYAIRLGGDEFCIILVDYAADLAIHLPERIIRNLQIIAPDKTVHFSAGIYNMQPNDTINDAYQASDAQLYLNKQQKQHRSS